MSIGKNVIKEFRGLTNLFREQSLSLSIKILKVEIKM